MPGSVAVVGSMMIRNVAPLKVEKSKDRMQAGLYEFSKNGECILNLFWFYKQVCINNLKPRFPSKLHIKI